MLVPLVGFKSECHIEHASIFALMVHIMRDEHVGDGRLYPRMSADLSSFGLCALFRMPKNGTLVALMYKR